MAAILVALSACRRPVKMSDAPGRRFPRHAPPVRPSAGIELDVATDLLSKAEAALQRGDHGAARRQAEEARTHAIEAQSSRPQLPDLIQGSSAQVSWARCVANGADARRTVQPMVDSAGKRCNAQLTRSRLTQTETVSASFWRRYESCRYRHIDCASRLAAKLAGWSIARGTLHARLPAVMQRICKGGPSSAGACGRRVPISATAAREASRALGLEGCARSISPMDESKLTACGEEASVEAFLRLALGGFGRCVARSIPVESRERGIRGGLCRENRAFSPTAVRSSSSPA